MTATTPAERRLVFSRKGFDSSFGGHPSPVLPDLRMVSIPIPEPSSPITYGNCLVEPGASFADCLIQMGVSSITYEHNGETTRHRLTPSLGAHLDPDLRHQARPGRPAQWRPLFGQSDSAQGHLRRQGVGPGDSTTPTSIHPHMAWKAGPVGR